jgi:chemotaxis protein CheX
MTNVKYLNPFIEAAVEVLQAECQVEAKKGNLSMQKLALTADDITVMLSLVGEVQGVVLYGLSTEAGLGLVSRVMGQEFTEMDNLAQSGIAELGNVITGQATIKLSEAGFASNISPPTLIQGKGTQISTLDFDRIIVLLNTEVGDFTVHLALRESPPGMRTTNYVTTIPAPALR